MVSNKQLATKKAANVQAASVNVAAQSFAVALNDALPTKGQANWDVPLNQFLTDFAAAYVATANAQVSYWQPNTAYVQAQKVLGPDGSTLAGQIIQANAAHTSGSTITVGNWTAVPVQAVTKAAVIASGVQATDIGGGSGGSSGVTNVSNGDGTGTLTFATGGSVSAVDNGDGTGTLTF